MRPALILSIALSAYACAHRASDKVVETAVVPTSAVEDSSDALTDDVLDRRIALRSEIRRLGSSHPWAGEYYYGDGLGVNVVLTLAPQGGCVATWRGCLGMYGKNYGPVSIHGDRLHVEFALPNAPGEFGHFDCDFIIEGTGENRLLRPPHGREELRVFNSQ
jgi:hypothetical protein